ncbi:unnamed protein product [Symbiodinium sp. CCMP2592]|nr:unnamed protein product [Symbiodinium sp. CCMP2592]
MSGVLDASLAKWQLVPRFSMGTAKSTLSSRSSESSERQRRLTGLGFRAFQTSSRRSLSFLASSPQDITGCLFWEKFYCHIIVMSWVSHVVQAGYFLEDDQQSLSTQPDGIQAKGPAFRTYSGQSQCFVYVLLQLSVELPPASMERPALAAVHHSPAWVTSSHHRKSSKRHW